MKYRVRYKDQSFDVEVAGDPPYYEVRIDGRPVRVDAAVLDNEAVMSLLVDGASVLGHVVPAGSGTYDVSIGGKVARLEVLDELSSMAQHMKSAADAGLFVLRAPMPGLIVRICVEVGQEVELGTPLVIMEAMKMQNELASEAKGIVREVRVLREQAVESGADLVVIESA